MIPGCLPPMVLSSVAQALGTVLRSGTLTIGTFTNGAVTLYGNNYFMGMGAISPSPFLVSTKNLFIVQYDAYTKESSLTFETGGVEPIWNSVVINGKTTLRSAAIRKYANAEMFTPGGAVAYNYDFAGDVLNGARSGTVPITCY